MRRKLVASGIAGIVIVLGEVVLNGWLLAPDWQAANRSLGLGQPGLYASLLALAKLFVLGFAIVWLYEAVVPKYGRGTSTAIRAGLFVALLIWVWAMLGFLLAGYVTWKIAWITMIWGLVEIPLASVLAVKYLDRNGAT